MKIEINKFDKEALDSATQKKFKPSVSLRAICGDIIIKEYQKQKDKKEKLEDYKEEYCEHCDSKHTCSDLDGTLMDEQVDICMNINKDLAGGK